MGDRTTDQLLIALGGLIVTVAVLHGAGHLATRLTGTRPPASDPTASLGMLAHPTDPDRILGTTGLHPIAYWTTTVILATAVAGIGVGVHLLAEQARSTATHPARRKGIATASQIRQAASRRALLRRAPTLRPSLGDPTAEDVGYLLGHARGQGVWASVEDSILILGPPRSGKGLHLVINAILDAPGPVITTSTRPDNLTATITARRQRGPVAIFDPQQLLPEETTGVRWSPVRGCQRPLTAMIRAAGLTARTGLNAGGVDNASFWDAKTRTVLQNLLHAAALDHQPTRTLYDWSLNPARARQATGVLRTHPDAAPGWADSLEATIDADPRTRDSIWHGVSLALSALANPQVLDALSPTPEETFDPAEFLRTNGTLYLLATASGAGATASILTAFVEDLIDTARQHAAVAPSGRLDPPLLLALDEIANLTPLPSLPTLMADGGGSGITTMPVLQSLAQARSRWGEHAAAAMFDAAIVKIILGGASNSRDLTDLTTLIGDRDEPTRSTSTDRHGHRTHQTSQRRIPILPVDAIRTLPFGTAITLLRSTPPIITTLRPWTDRRDTAEQATTR